MDADAQARTAQTLRRPNPASEAINQGVSAVVFRGVQARPLFCTWRCEVSPSRVHGMRFQRVLHVVWALRRRVSCKLLKRFHVFKLLGVAVLVRWLCAERKGIEVANLAADGHERMRVWSLMANPKLKATPPRLPIPTVTDCD